MMRHCPLPDEAGTVTGCPACAVSQEELAGTSGPDDPIVWPLPKYGTRLPWESMTS